MPPKRKHKATKAAPVSPNKAPAHTASEGPSTKPGQVRRNSLGGRTSHLPPFSMTTRRGLKTASAASSANSGSRRSSLDDVAPSQDAPSDVEDEQPAKDSGSPMSNGSSNNKTSIKDSITVASPPASKSVGKKRRASDSTQSSSTAKTRPSNALTRHQSDVSEQQPRRKKRKTAAAPAESADQPPELTDASTAPNSPEQLPDVDGNQSLQNVLPTNGDAPAKPGRRLPGRRRQPHSDINIEIDLRRQLRLKMDYRSLAKVQKSILEELSKRTIDNLKNIQDYHKQCPEYAPLMEQLDLRRQGRVDQIHAVRTYRMEQLERVRTAEEHIQREQYINRFRDLQDDYLLQCYFRMKRLEREMKGEESDVTDDEDNILPPTYMDEPHHDVEDRIGSKYASRSRAYVEADKELEDDVRRKKFALARAAFVAKDEDADDSIDDVSGGFARFAGPNRDEAVAHYNLMSMVDAAFELERTPTPRVEEPQLQVIPNAQAVDLMMLAELSAHQTHDHATQKTPQSFLQPQEEEEQPPQPASPPHEQTLTQQVSPVKASQPPPLPPQIAHSSPVKASPASVHPHQQIPHSDPSGTPIASRDVLPARVTTHRIMDILNNDQDVPVYRPRESQPSQPLHHPQQEPGTPTRRASAVSQHTTPSHNAAPSVDSTVDNEQPVDQALMDALGGRPSEPPSPHVNHQPWSRQSAAPARELEEAPRSRKDPLQKIRELLDRKAREHGREPPDRSNHRSSVGSFLPRVSSMQVAHDRQDTAGYDPTHPSAGLYGSPSSVAHSYHVPARRESQDHGLPHWERNRRTSGSQAPQQLSQSPYNNPSQLHQGEHNRTTTPSAHQSPYSLPSGSLPLPPKPPGPPPPVSFRFAHYDPAPPRPSYPPTSPTYPPDSRPLLDLPSSSQYPPSYHSSYQGGYVPPPGSFQAPPPPPHLASYPPLKIHQYGGQPILPASMAPPPHIGPPLSYHGQQLPLPPLPPPPPPPSAYFAAQGLPPQQQQQHDTARGEESRPVERPEPQQRPRRQYRSYHAPGTQFRSYQGPKQGARRES